ncbi:hypothetical protein [Salipaludibacillus sp. CF4.18]|uniref:hypothetical protein n=1 Tax=Salipaludibacillus sp. CF4.18 TaxID=3373081 RepID=UPI003EE6C3BA
MKLDSSSQINPMIESINSANKMDGAVDMAEGDFDIRIVQDNSTEKHFHLWLDKNSERSTIMDVGDTHTIYSISESSTKTLKDLLLD